MLFIVQEPSCFRRVFVASQSHPSLGMPRVQSTPIYPLILRVETRAVSSAQIRNASSNHSPGLRCRIQGAHVCVLQRSSRPFPEETTHPHHPALRHTFRSRSDSLRIKVRAVHIMFRVRRETIPPQPTLSIRKTSTKKCNETSQGQQQQQRIGTHTCARG